MTNEAAFEMVDFGAEDDADTAISLIFGRGGDADMVFDLMRGYTTPGAVRDRLAVRLGGRAIEASLARL